MPSPLSCTLREPHSLTARMDALLFWAALAAKALGGAAALLIVSWASETAYYQGLKWLERLGAIERLAPQIKETDTKYKAQTAWTSFLSAAFVLFIALHPRNLQPLLDLAEPRLDWLEIALTCWLGVAAHDLWFYLIHSLLHKSKWLYRRIHVLHHLGFGDLTVFGHCGYRQPLWLALLQSWGACLTPGAAHAKTHYIHHLDPRYNRALYFSWWDRLGGTFRDKHHQIREFTPVEQWEYEMRAPRLLMQWVMKHLYGREATRPLTTAE